MAVKITAPLSREAARNLKAGDSCLISGVISLIGTFVFMITTSWILTLITVVSNIVPARWYIDATRKMMIQGVPLVAVWTDFVILLGMTVILIIVSLKKFNDKLE